MYSFYLFYVAVLCTCHNIGNVSSTNIIGALHLKISKRQSRVDICRNLTSYHIHEVRRTVILNL